MFHILLADDDKTLCGMLKQYLEGEGFDVSLVHNGRDALATAKAGEHDLMVLDIMMPEMSGLDVLKSLRRESSLPVLVLTARGEDVDSIIGLGLGADDYMAKPFNPRVLLARMQAILRRAQIPESAATDGDRTASEQFDDLELIKGERRVLLDRREILMTSTEYNVLELLLDKAGQVVTKDELSQHALGRKLTRYDRSIDMHVSSIRKKLGPLANGRERIVTVRGVGYQYIHAVAGF